MKNFIKSVTLKLSQSEVNYLQNGVNAKYFMDIMPEITSFISGDALTFRGAAIGTDFLDFDFENMADVDKEQIQSYLAGLTSIVFSAEQLATCSLAA